MAGLKSAAESCESSMRHPTRVGGTRWVGHVLTALKNLLTDKVFVIHLEQVSKVKFIGNKLSMTEFFHVFAFTLQYK